MLWADRHDGVLWARLNGFVAYYIWHRASRDAICGIVFSPYRTS
ncbi:hypothetical protein Z949_833 [Sulfitobacter guttiformis KCTC 32187]|nr:hypothetical protein Z949_833 [Sulfitobacter guttiformis KCTC 32187]